MYTRWSGLLAILLSAAVAGSAQQAPTGQQPLRSPVTTDQNRTPGFLGGLRRDAAPRPSIDTTGLAAPVGDVWDVDAVSGAQYRRGEVLVRFRDGVNTTLRARAMQQARGNRFVRSLPGNWSLMELQPATTALQSMSALRTMPEVREVSLNFRVRAHQVRPNDEFFHLQWNFDAINMPVAWQINPGSRNDVIVAVIDTGVNTVTGTFLFSTPIGQIPLRFGSVPDLVTDERIASAFDFVYDDELPLDLDGHGTHVAGTIAQQTNNSIGLAGVAYNVKLMPLKVLTSDWDDILFPQNPGGTDAVVADAVRYAADNGARIINMSLGGPGPAPVLRDAIAYAVSKGAFVSMSAGNSGDAGNPVDYPAAYGEEINGAMAVGAVNRELTRTSYSTHHPYVEICAPGGEMTSEIDFERGVTQVSYEEAATRSFDSILEKFAALLQGFRPTFDRFEPRPFNGTSMSAPHVAGVAALLYSQGIRSPAAIEEAIERFARPIDATPEECGAGLVDARRALRGLGLAR